MKIKGIGRNASESAHPVQTFLKAHTTLFCTVSSWFGPNSMKKRQISMFWGYPLKFLLYCLPLENTQTQQSCRQKHQNAHFIIITPKLSKAVDRSIKMLISSSYRGRQYMGLSPKLVCLSFFHRVVPSLRQNYKKQWDKTFLKSLHP